MNIVFEGRLDEDHVKLVNEEVELIIEKTDPNFDKLKEMLTPRRISVVELLGQEQGLLVGAKNMDQAKRNLIFLGSNSEGKVVVDLAETPNLLVFGEASSGKTALLRNVVVHALLNKDVIELVELDLESDDIDVMDEVMTLTQTGKTVYVVVDNADSLLVNEKLKQVDQLLGLDNVNVFLSWEFNLSTDLDAELLPKTIRNIELKIGMLPLNEYVQKLVYNEYNVDWAGSPKDGRQGVIDGELFFPRFISKNLFKEVEAS